MRRKQQNQRKKQKYWYQNNFIDRYIYLERKQVKGYQQKIMRPCDRGKGRICAEEEKGVSIVKKREKRNT